MQSLKNARKVAKGFGIASFKTMKGTKKAKSVEELQREIHKKIVKQQSQISQNFIKTCKHVLKSIRSTGTRKPKQKPYVPRFEPQIGVLVPPVAKPPPPPPPPPPPMLKKKISPRKFKKNSPPKLGIREQLIKELKNKVEKGKIKRMN
tara:strand:- start:8748 stop:9191 length:444 start_codon:yes stop_codon:yes gene_type:complete